MSNETVFWDVRSDDDHALMARFLAPLIVASQNRNFIDKQAAKAQTYAWRLTLADVPKPIVEQAIANLVARGVTWMPKPGDVKKECAEVVNQKRKLVRQHFLESCTHSSQWIEGERGLERCPCWLGMQKALEQVDRPIELPPSREDFAEVGDR
jgi:hypothetical protein